MTTAAERRGQVLERLSASFARGVARVLRDLERSIVRQLPALQAGGRTAEAQTMQALSLRRELRAALREAGYDRLLDETTATGFRPRQPVRHFQPAGHIPERPVRERTDLTRYQSYFSSDRWHTTASGHFRNAHSVGFITHAGPSDPSQDIDALRVKLAEFTDRPDILGLVIDLSSQSGGSPLYPRVAQANQITDAHPSCVTAKNTVAAEIKNVIDLYRAANSSGAGTTTLKYILLVGGDSEIPFCRYPDTAGLASEAEYIPPVKDDSASEASLRSSQVLGQDEYGAEYLAARSGYAVPVPQIAVSRLLRTVEQINAVLDADIAVNGVISPEVGAGHRL